MKTKAELIQEAMNEFVRDAELRFRNNVLSAIYKIRGAQKVIADAQGRIAEYQKEIRELELKLPDEDILGQ